MAEEGVPEEVVAAVMAAFFQPVVAEAGAEEDILQLPLTLHPVLLLTTLWALVVVEGTEALMATAALTAPTEETAHLAEQQPMALR
jgi:hypothetical protein